MDPVIPELLSPVYISNNTDKPPPSGTVAIPARTVVAAGRSAARTCVQNGAAIGRGGSIRWMFMSVGSVVMLGLMGCRLEGRSVEVVKRIFGCAAHYSQQLRFYSIIYS